jgi:hypothetical protein
MLKRSDAAIADRAGVERAEHVQAEHGLGLEVAEDALLEHFLGAAFLAVRRTFLGGLEHEQDLARQLGLHRRQRLGHAHQDRGMRVVAAGVHHADGLAAEGRRGLRRERQIAAFGHRQRVHVGAQRDARAGLAALEHRDHAGGGDAGLHLEAELAEVLRDQLRRANLAVAQFGMLVDVATPGQHLGLQALRLRVDLGARAVGGLCGQTCRERGGKRDGERGRSGQCLAHAGPPE